MNTIKDAFRAIRIIHLALMLGPTIFAVVVGFLVTTGERRPAIEVLNYVSPAYFFMVLALHPMIFKSALNQHSIKVANLKQKLASFQTAHLVRTALMETSALFAAVAALVNYEILHLITVALSLALMYTKLPTPSLLENELALNREEKDELTAL